MSEWQPIATAPKDKMLLGVVDGRVRFIAYGKTSHVPMYGWCLADQGAEEFDLCKPTHWMPLPEPHGIAGARFRRRVRPRAGAAEIGGNDA